MLRQRLLFLGGFYVVFCMGFCFAEELKIERREVFDFSSIISGAFGFDASDDSNEDCGLMYELGLANINSLQTNRNILNIKECANRALAGDKESCGDCDFNCLIKLDDTDSINAGHEAPASDITKKRLAKDLSGHMNDLVNNFFKTVGYSMVKKNIEAFKQFIFSCPAWQSFKDDKNELQASFCACLPEGSFMQDYHPKITYIYEGGKITGVKFFTKVFKQLRSSPYVAIDVEYTYSYLFDFFEKKKVDLFDLGKAPFDLSVNVSPGHRFEGAVSFICCNNGFLKKYDLISYIFFLRDAEEVKLKEEATLNKNSEAMSSVTPGLLGNEILFKSFVDYSRIAL